jgi:hypothetical protein
MVKTNKLFLASSVLTALVVSLLASPAAAEIATPHGPPMAEQLAEFKRTAFEMRREADTLKSFTPYKNLHWKSHTSRLSALKEYVNDMGRSLTELEAQSVVVTEGHALAIEQARPHLAAVAENLTQAIELVNEDRTNVRWGEYGEAVSNIYSHADVLHNKLDTILDYENARMRYDNLQLEPAAAAGS